MSSLRTYYLLTKPGIIRGNVITTLAGFLLASKVAEQPDLLKLATVLVGVSAIIAAACVCNNYTDRAIDTTMARTQKRGALTSAVSVRKAMAYATALGLAGLTLLGVYANLLTAALGVIAFFFYVVLYGIGKRHSVHGTLVGTVPGALPPVAGYVAVSGSVDTAAVLLFLGMVFWQMPHFFAIAIYRLRDYANASLPVMPVKRGIPKTKRAILCYIAAYTATAPLLTIFGYTSIAYATIAVGLGLGWLSVGIKGMHQLDATHWARSMFFFSLLVMTFTSAALSVDALLG